MPSLPRMVATALLAAAVAACSVVPPHDFPRAENVDLPRFMGAWYVIAHIPPWVTSTAYNSIERYEQVEPGVIQTVFTYREGSFDGEAETMKPTGYVVKGTENAIWGMQFFWPIRMEYTISYVDPDYQTTIVARSALDWVWILARTPIVEPATYDDLIRRVRELGYDTAELRRVPQQPLAERDDI